MEKIRTFLKQNGEALDKDIALATGYSLNRVRELVEQLSAKGDLISCSVKRFQGNKEISGISCRLSGLLPKPTPGRKPGTNVSTSSVH